MEHAKRLRLPFDPFAEPARNAFNVIKSEASVKRRQVEIAGKLKDILDPL